MNHAFFHRQRAWSHCGAGPGGGRTILLRVDMDALPMPEESGESFSCPTGTEAHACGHDFHAAMLLTAAKMLKENESLLSGRVRFMFQSVDGFRIMVYGRGAHGAYPHNSIDPINIGVHIYLALESLIAREADPGKACVLTVGNFSAGSAANIIPDTAVLQGTLRTNDGVSRKKLVRRLKETVQKTAEVYGGTAKIEMISEVPPLVCDPAMTDEMADYMKELPIPGLTPVPDMSASASEDFATIAEKVPSVFMYLSAGFEDERGDVPAHNPRIRFNEDVCPVGSACLAHCAVRWLEEHP